MITLMISLILGCVYTCLLTTSSISNFKKVKFQAVMSILAVGGGLILAFHINRHGGSIPIRALAWIWTLLGSVHLFLVRCLTPKTKTVQD
jgi:hypothetical protein